MTQDTEGAGTGGAETVDSGNGDSEKPSPVSGGAGSGGTEKPSPVSGGAGKPSSEGGEGRRGRADIKRLLLIGIPLLLLAGGIKLLDDEARLLWAESNETHSTAARFFLFSGEKERILKANEDQTVRIEWKPEVERGSLSLEVVTPSGKTVLVEEGGRSLDLDLDKGEKVRLTVHGERAKGRFILSWGAKEGED